MEHIGTTWIGNVTEPSPSSHYQPPWPPRDKPRRTGWRCEDCNLVMAPWVAVHRCENDADSAGSQTVPVLNKTS